VVVLVGYLLIPTLLAAPWAHRQLGPALAAFREASRVQAKLLAVVLGGVVAFAVGLADDFMGERFPVWLKALGQIAAAVVLIAAGVRTSFLPHDWMNVLLTVFWVVGITNAFNLLDNMDGLSAGVAFVASGVLLLNAWSLGGYFIALLLLAFMGSLAGFLFFNFRPASVFLGDCGSLFIGYTMASIILLERFVTHATSLLFPVLMPVVILAIPILDTATVVFIRVREGRPIYVGDDRHLSHRLVAIGFSQRAAVLFIYLATFCLGLGVVALKDASLGESLVILLQAAVFVALLLILMFVDRRPREERA